VIENLKLTKFMGIANRFFTFFEFLEKKGSADVDAWFGIGQGYKPYPTNDTSACCE